MRVIAGTLGGRQLRAPRGDATRPTSDRVREALFSVLGDVGGAVVLDLYAGTGALGIEALSRGAARAVFVESARAALRSLRENLASLGLADFARVFGAPAARVLGEAARLGPFHLVLADPPYAEAERALALLERLAEMPEALAPGARLVLEHASRDRPTASRLLPRARKVYGDTALSFFDVVRAH